MKLPKLNDIKTEDQARQLAIDWQNWQSEQSLSYGELHEWEDLFRKLGRDFYLTAEFSENGII